MRIFITPERVRSLYEMHKRFPENIIIVIIQGKWFECEFGRDASWFIAGGVKKQSVEFTLFPLFKE